MFTDQLFRPKAQNGALFYSPSADSQDIFQNLCLESIIEAKKKALQARVLSSQKAGTNQPPEIVSGSTDKATTMSSSPKLNEPAILYETNQQRLHQNHKILSVAGEGHFGKVYKVLCSQDGATKAAKVATAKSRSVFT